MGAKRGVIAIKKKYTEVAEILEQAMAGTGLELFGLDNFYPAGDEQILVYEVTGSTIPPLGLPKDVGVGGGQCRHPGFGRGGLGRKAGYQQDPDGDG